MVTQTGSEIQGKLEMGDFPYVITLTGTALRTTLNASFSMRAANRIFNCSLNLTMDANGDSCSGTMRNNALNQSFDWTGERTSENKSP